MNLIQQKMIQDLKDRGGKVFVFDRGASTAPTFYAMAIERAERLLARMRRHGSPKVKVAADALASRIGRSPTIDGMQTMKKNQQLYVLIALKMAADSGVPLSVVFDNFAKRNVARRRDFWKQVVQHCGDSKGSLAGSLSEIFDEVVVQILTVSEVLGQMPRGIAEAINYLGLVEVA